MLKNLPLSVHYLRTCLYAKHFYKNTITSRLSILQSLGLYYYHLFISVIMNRGWQFLILAVLIISTADAMKQTRA